MSADFVTIYENLYANLLRISEQLSGSCITFSERWGLMSVDKLKEMQDNAKEEHKNQKPKIMRNEKKCFIFGDTSAGKSTLINAILKRKHLPTKKGRTTNCFVEIKKSQNNRTYFKANGKEEDIKYLLNKINYTHKDHFSNGTRVEVFYSSQDCPILEDDTVIIDTPGIDTDKEMDKYIGEYCKDADLIVLVVDSTKSINNTMKQFIRKSSTIFSKLKFFLIYNFWDKGDEDSEESENSEDDKDDGESDNHRNDHSALKKQLLKDANELFKECLQYPAGLENERIFFISAKEQMKFNKINKYLNDDEDWKNRHEEFKRFLDKLQEVIIINANKRKYEYLEELCDVQMKVLDECKSVIGIIEDEMQRISLKYFIELKYFERTIIEEINEISKQCYERLIKSLLRESNRNEDDIINESMKTISKQSLDELIGKLLTEIKNKRDGIIKDSITSILQLSYDKFITDLDREINKKRDVRVKESIESISKKSFSKIEQDLFRKIKEKDDNLIKGITKSLSKQCYDNLIKDSVKEMNKRCDGNIKNFIKSLLEQSYDRLKEDLTKEIYEKGKELIKDALKSLLEQSSDKFIEYLYDNINKNNENMILLIESLPKLSYNELTKKIFDEINKKNRERVKTIFESIRLNSCNVLKQYLLKEFCTNDEGIVEGLLKESCDNFIKELFKAVEEIVATNSIEIPQKQLYDNLIRNLYRIKNDNFDCINKDLIEKIFNQSFETFIKELQKLKNDEAIKESIDSILKEYFDKVTQDLLREINPDEFDRIKESNESITDLFYTNLTQDLLSRMNKKVNEVFKIEIKVNSDRSYDYLLRDLFVVSNKYLKMTKEINESIKKQFCDKLVSDLSKKIIKSESKVIKEWKESTFNKFCECLREDLFKEIGTNNNFLMKECIEPVLKSFYESMYQDLLNEICIKTEGIMESSVPLISQRSYTLIINNSFEGIDRKYDGMDTYLIKLAEQSYKILTQELQREINKNNDVKIKNLIESISQQSSDNFIKDSSRVFKDKCKERITDPIESISKPFWDQLITNLFKEIDQICIEMVQELIMSKLNESLQKLTKDLHRETSDKRDATIKDSIEYALKDSQQNLIEKLFGVLNVKVEDLMRQSSMNKTTKTLFSNYLTDIKEKVKSIIKESDNTNQMFIIDNLYFPYYLEPHFPSVDSSTISNMNKSGNRYLGIASGLAGATVTLGVAIISAPIAAFVGIGGLIVSAICALGVGNAAEKFYNFNEKTKNIIKFFWKENEQIMKESWDNFAALICGSNSTFITEIKYKLLELFESERKQKDLKEITEALDCIYKELNESKNIFTDPSTVS